MARERVLTIQQTGLADAREVSLTALGHRERQDLQQWIIADPTLLEDGLLVLAEEYDKWAPVSGRAIRDRLDLLALDQTGRLVVVELKRDDAPADVHLQAITYAAMVSRFTEDDLAGIYAQFLQRHGEAITDLAALDRLRAHCDSQIDPQLLRRPRMILVARSFPRQVTSSAVWLNEMGLDVKLIQVRAWDTPTGRLLTISVLYPVPGTEEFVVDPARAESAKASRLVSENARNAKAVVRILAARALRAGDVLNLRVGNDFGAEAADQIRGWVAEDPSRSHATWVEDKARPLRWEHD